VRYEILHKDWFYSYVNIPNLDIVKKELLDLYATDHSNFSTWQTNPHYYHISAKNGLPLCPEINRFLQSAGLAGRLVAFFYSRNLASGEPYAHVDSYNPMLFSENLNIPLIECSNSYTVWYSTDRAELEEIKVDGRLPGHVPAYTPLEGLIEIKRVEVVRPMIVNTTILHKGEAQTDTRTICGLRFNGPLKSSDLLNLGVPEPFVQAD
jgi:hypothetical protein